METGSGSFPKSVKLGEKAGLDKITVSFVYRVKAGSFYQNPSFGERSIEQMKRLSDYVNPYIGTISHMLTST